MLFFSSNNGKNWFVTLTKRRHFENAKLLAGNDHVIDNFASKDMENIST